MKAYYPASIRARSLRGYSFNLSGGRNLKEVSEIKDAQRNIIGKLTEEIITLRNEMRKLKRNNSCNHNKATNSLPTMPLNTIEGLK